MRHGIEVQAARSECQLQGRQMMLTRVLADFVRRSRLARTENITHMQVLEDARRLLHTGDTTQAERLCRRALEMCPQSAEARYLLGVLLGQQGQLQEAAVLLQAAVNANPDSSQAHTALGNVYLLQANRQMAAASYLQAIRLDPDNASAHANLGLIRQRANQHEAALSCFIRAHELAPELPVGNLTQVWLALGRFDHALALLQDLHRKQPERFDVLKCLVQVLRTMHRPDEALDYGLEARALDSTDVELRVELGAVLRDLGRLDEAMESLNAALALQPDSIVALWHRSLIYLLRQDFTRGWQDYDLRFASEELSRRPDQYPAWDGILGAGRRILVYGEQGIGDEIMFASCLPEMIASADSCFVECSPKLETLFRRSFPGATLFASSPDKSVPAAVRDRGIDAQIAMGSIPRYLRNSRSDFPLRRGYLVPARGRVEHWHRQLHALGTGFRVGISWYGGSHLSRRPVRSIPLQQWRPILSVDGVHFVDLQYFDCSEEIDELEDKCGLRIHRWEALRTDYEDAAAMVSALDLVISVCTAVVHLGGALGKPVWVMAPYSPEWRYGIAGEEMPWYPSVRVFRQPRYGDWQPVIARVADELSRRANAHLHGTGG
jgi:tetratricopeptide (TPR) repeat protein